MPGKYDIMNGFQDYLFKNNFFDVISSTDNKLIIQLRVSGTVGFIGYDIEIRYDDKVLTLISQTEGLYDVINDSGSGMIRLNYVNVSNRVENSQTIVTMEFEIKNHLETSLEVIVHDMIDIINDHIIVDSSYHVINCAISLH